MATGNVTITTAANFIPEYWDGPILEALHDELVAANLMDRRWEKLLKPGGDKVNVPGLAELAARTLTNMTGTITFDTSTESTTQIVVNTLAYRAAKIDSAARVQSTFPELELYTKDMGRAIAEKIDTDCFADLDGTSQAEGTDNIDLTDDNVRRSLQYILDAKAPDDGQRFIAISPATLMGFYTIEAYRSSLYATASLPNKFRGYCGKIYNSDVYTTTNLPAGASGTKNFFWHRWGSALCIQEGVKVERRLPHDELAEAVIAWTMYGIKTMRATLIVEMDGK